MDKGQQFPGLNKPSCYKCNEELAYDPNHAEQVEVHRDEERRGIPGARYLDPEFKAHSETQASNRGWRHVNDRLTAKHLGVKGRLTTDHKPIPSDNRTDDDEKHRMLDIMISIKNRRKS